MRELDLKKLLDMPPGLELDCLVAEFVFNWRWMKYQAPNHPGPLMLTGIFPPDAPGRWPCPNYYWKIWEPSDHKAPRFSDIRNVIWWDEEGAVQHFGLPEYSTEPFFAYEVMSCLTSTGCEVTIKDHLGLSDARIVDHSCSRRVITDEGTGHYIRNSDPRILYVEHKRTFPHAISIAGVLTVYNRYLFDTPRTLSIPSEG